MGCNLDIGIKLKKSTLIFLILFYSLIKWGSKIRTSLFILPNIYKALFHTPQIPPMKWVEVTHFLIISSEVIFVVPNYNDKHNRTVFLFLKTFNISDDFISPSIGMIISKSFF